MNEHIQINFLIKKEWLLLRPDLPVREAIAILIAKRMPQAFVVDEHENLLGVFTEHDALRPFMDSIYFEAERGLVRDFMTTEITALHPDDNLLSAAQKFIQSKGKILPVLRNKEIVGHVSRRDLLSALNQEWIKKDHDVRASQAPMIGRWAHRFKSDGGSALPEGFNNSKRKD